MKNVIFTHSAFNIARTFAPAVGVVPGVAISYCIPAKFIKLRP